ncbi:MAG: tyrosine-type recombinase/integrase [Chitinophagaceae bacterium]
MAVFFMPDVNFKDPINRFLEYLKFEKRYSQKTVISYQTDLNQFQEYFELEYPESGIGEISSFMIKSWLVKLREEKLEPRSINRKISALKSFFRFLLKQDLLKTNPASSVRVLKTSKRLPNFVQEQHMPEIMDFPINGSEHSWKDITENLLVELLYVAGLRVSELIELKESQLDVQRGQIRVLGKGNKERLIPLHEEMIDKLIAYIKQKKEMFGVQDTLIFLFVNGLGRKLNAQYAYRAVKSRLMLVRDLSKRSPHVLRHTFATHLMNNGADLNAVKELLGHASLAATQVYTHNTIEKLRELHQKSHPRG